MGNFPTDIYTEPSPVDVDTLANLGPLKPLAGIWTGADGLDTKPKAAGPKQQTYVERMELQPIDPVTNGPQLLYGLRYHTTITKPAQVKQYHEQVGYWLWEPATSTVIHTLAIPRGVIAMAGAVVAPDARQFTLVATAGLDDWGICALPFLNHAFRTTEFRIDVAVHEDGSWSYDEDTVLQIVGQAEPFHHTDRNLLKKIGEATPNPLALQALRNRPERMNRYLAMLMLLTLSACANTAPRADDALRFIVVRHAEKTDDGSRDPALNAKGQARAQALREALADEPLQAVYATDFQRTRQTAQPAAQAHQVEMTTYDAKQPAAEFAAQLRQRHASGAVLVVGHSNTVPDILAALCECKVPPLDETEYDRLSVVELASGHPPRLARHRYGSSEREAVAGADFEMGAGEQVSLGGLGSLRYDKLVADSRCPPDAQCIWAGDAEVQFSWTPNGGKAESFSLHTGSEPRNRSLAGYVLELKSLGRSDDPRAALKLRAGKP